MNELFFWLLGSAVPIAFASVIYYGWLENFLNIKNAHSNCQFLSDICKGYLHTKLHVENAKKNKVRWMIFGSRYIDLLNYHADKLLYEIDHITTFECSKEGFPLYTRNSFLDQWNEIDKMLLDRDSIEGEEAKTLRSYFGEDPFGWISVVIEGKIFELYRKYVLHILRTKGYTSFDETICFYYKKGKLYPESLPMHSIYKTITEKIIYDSRIEIAERIWSDWNSKSLRRTQEFEALIKTFIYKQTMDIRDREIVVIKEKILNSIVY